jgi:hypothetical protein
MSGEEPLIFMVLWNNLHSFMFSLFSINKREEQKPVMKNYVYIVTIALYSVAKLSLDVRFSSVT